MSKVDRFRLRPLVQSLATAYGFSNSESASEEFVALLARSASKVVRSIERSHRQGLCYDGVTALADELRALGESTHFVGRFHDYRREGRKFVAHCHPSRRRSIKTREAVSGTIH